MSERMGSLWRFVLVSAVVNSVGLVAAVTEAPTPHFARDVLPILSQHCFACHGPDAEQHDDGDGLRLDTFAHATAERDGAFPIVPGDAEQSELIYRILDRDDPMPPEKHHKPLSEEQQQTLIEWVKAGAVYEQHWAWQPLPDQVPAPAVKNQDWPVDRLDRFVLASLEAQGLEPTAPADDLRWLRRVSYDLTGLPPSEVLIADFTAATDEEAAEQVVDQLLASPHYGERMATMWLDGARYGDTHGYQFDRDNNMWPYRDWVIQAFNDNLSYDRFITWQLAGDLLPDATREQRLATAFNRLHRMTNEGGSVPREFRIEGVADRVETMGTTMLALTMQCARCHDHKYDAITQEDYFSLSAYFNNINELGVYPHFGNHRAEPTLDLPNEQQELALNRARSQLRQVEMAWHALQDDADVAQRFQAWQQEVVPTIERPAPVIHLDFDGRVSDATGRTQSDESTVSVEDQVVGKKKNKKKDKLTGRPQAYVDGVVGQAAEFSGDHSIELPQSLRFQRWQDFSISTWVWIPADMQKGVICHQSKAWLAATGRGWELTYQVPVDDFGNTGDQGRVHFRLAHFYPHQSIEIAADVPTERWVHVVATYDGSSRAAGLNLYLNGQRADSEILNDNLRRSIDKQLIQLAARFRDRGLAGGRMDQFQLFNRQIFANEVKALMHSDDSPTVGEVAWWLRAHDQIGQEAWQALTAARKKVAEEQDKVGYISVMEEMAGRRLTFVLNRGAYDSPDLNRPVSPRPIASLFTTADDLPANRLGLAQWLTHPRHPLTARVLVNRLWNMLFYRGLVASIDNFGLQGAYPSHPQLLDALARDFIASGWDTKALLRRIVLSSTYRQDSRTTPERRAADPENIWLSRGPAKRLTGEMLRDTVLAVSGQLVRHIGGPPVRPYLPENAWANTKAKYKPGKGDQLLRRSLYSYIKRTAPAANMSAFDMPSREFCAVDRPSTNTPQQALVLLNDEQFIEPCRVLAEGLMKLGLGMPEAIGVAFTRLTGRTPDEGQAAALLGLYESQLAWYQDRPEEAQAWLSIGSFAVSSEVDQAACAALGITVNAILNLDATVWSR